MSSGSIPTQMIRKFLCAFAFARGGAALSSGMGHSSRFGDVRVMSAPTASDRTCRCPRSQRPATLPTLRRPHDHHRDLRAWLNASVSAESSDGSNQDRHLMTTPVLRSRKVVRSLSWFSTGGDGARSNIQPSTQIAQQPSSLDRRGFPLTARTAVRQCAPSARIHSGASSAAIKSP